MFCRVAHFLTLMLSRHKIGMKSLLAIEKRKLFKMALFPIVYTFFSISGCNLKGYLRETCSRRC